MIPFFEQFRIAYRFSRLNRILWWIATICISTLILNQLFLLYINKRYPKEYIDEQFAPLVAEYGIKIVYEIGDDYFSPLIDPIIPAGPPKKSKISPIRHRVLLKYPHILNTAFEKYPINVINNYLNGIYFAGKVDDDGFRYAGSYDPFRRIIYLVDHGWKSDKESEEIIHHELSSLFLKRHSLLLNPWFGHNHSEFEYISKTEKDWTKIYKTTQRQGSESDYANGFMNSYGQSDFENDFNEYSAMIFTYPQKFKKIMERYPRVRGKFLVWLKFYNKIDPIFTEDYLFGNDP